MRFIKTSRIPIFIYILIICSLFYIWNWGAPMLQDDYWTNFRLIRQENGTILHTQERISTWWQFFESYYLHRIFHFNGRVSDIVGGLISFIGGKELFNYLNTLVFLAFIVLASRLSFKKITFFSVSVVLLTSYIILPAIDATFGWHMAACGYLWGSVLYMLYLLLSKDIYAGQCTSKAKLAGSAFIGLICGFWHEALALPLLAASGCAFLSLSYNKKRIDWQIFILCCAIFAGALVLLTAPAAWHRAVHSTDDGLNSVLLSSLKALLIHHGKNACIAIILIFIFKRLKFSPSPNNLFLLFAGLMTVAVGGKSWGGAHYFFCLSALFFFISNIPQLTKRVQCATGIITTILCLSFLTVEAKNHVTYRLLFEDYLKQASDSANCLVYQCDDLHPQKGAGWLPSSPHNSHYPYVGKYLGREDIWSFCRTSKRDTNIYADIEKLFEGSQISVVQHGDSIIIRIPCKDYIYPPDTYVQAKLKDGTVRNYRNSNLQYSIIRRIFHYIKGEKLGYLEFDYYEGNYYLILKDECDLSGEFKFSVQDPSTKQIEIKLRLNKSSDDLKNTQSC